MRIHLAGADTTRFAMAPAVAGCGCFLTSYYHCVRGRFKSEELKRHIALYHHLSNRGAEWIMDSGLFTMMFGAGKGKKYSKADLLAYTDRYIDDMEQIGFRHTIVEMDVHKVLGMADLPEFRAKFESRWGVERTMFVFHLEETIDGLKALARRYPYIALSVPELRLNVHRIGGDLSAAIKRMVGIARRENPNVKIHLLGCTTLKLMELDGVWSCDSSSWLQGNSFALNKVFAGGDIITIRRRTPQAQELINRAKPEVLNRWRQLEREAGIESKLNYQCASLAVNAHAYMVLNRHIRARYYHNEPLPQIVGMGPLL